jgi:hypothetical protein
MVLLLVWFWGSLYLMSCTIFRSSYHLPACRRVLLETLIFRAGDKTISRLLCGHMFLAVFTKHCCRILSWAITIQLIPLRLLHRCAKNTDVEMLMSVCLCLSASVWSHNLSWERLDGLWPVAGLFLGSRFRNPMRAWDSSLLFFVCLLPTGKRSPVLGLRSFASSLHWLSYSG